MDLKYWKRQSGKQGYMMTSSSVGRCDSHRFCLVWYQHWQTTSLIFSNLNDNFKQNFTLAASRSSVLSQTGKSWESFRNENAKGNGIELPLHISCLLRNSVAYIHYLEQRRLRYEYAFLSHDTQIRTDNFSLFVILKLIRRKYLTQKTFWKSNWSLLRG